LSAAAHAHVEPPSDEQKLERFLSLRAHFRNAGCCWACSLAFALTQVSRECGDRDVPATCWTPELKCREKANAAKKTMPRGYL